jgi:hypothetical protein
MYFICQTADTLGRLSALWERRRTLRETRARATRLVNSIAPAERDILGLHMSFARSIGGVLGLPLRLCGILAWGTSPGLDIVDGMLNYRIM